MKVLIKNLSFLLIFILASCESDLASPAATDTGIAGSYARFLVVGDYMYIVDRNSLKTFNVNKAADPELINTQPLGENIETIFHYSGRLFIGSSNAMLIYSIQEDGLPQRTSQVDYEVFFATPCDPIVANDEFAYVTLNSTTEVQICRNTGFVQTNVLKIYNITSIEQPELIAEYPMHSPKGIGLDGQTLFLCDDTEGLKIFDVSDPLDIKMIAHLSEFTAFDVIPLNGLLLVVGPENIYQFDYSDLNNIVQVGTIAIES